MLHRRDAMLKLGAIAGGGLALPQLLAAEKSAAESAARKKSAKSCIFLFMWGGQPQQDMWDLKPDAPAGVRSPYKPIATNAPGIQLGESLPRLARHADKLAIIRSLNHGSSDHQVSVYHALTGRPMVPPRTFPANARTRSDFPTVGSLFSYLGGPSQVPASFSLPRPVAHDSIRYAGTHAGFLGSAHDPVELGRVFNHVETGLPPDDGYATLPLNRPAGLSEIRQLARRGLLDVLESTDRAMQNNPNVSAFDGMYEAAYRLVNSTGVKEALDLERESAASRDRYGRNEYGESFLTARRLIEAGVRLVTVNWMFITPKAKVYNVWDVHGGLADLEHGMKGFDMLNAHYCLPAFDHAFAALLEDLSQRGLLDETLVACAGEFGRTPKINGNNGRDHWPFCYSAVLAGGGVRGGTVFGSSDKQAAYVDSNPVTPGDYLATICSACGLDPSREILDQQGRPYRACDGDPIRDVLA